VLGLVVAFGPISRERNGVLKRAKTKTTTSRYSQNFGFRILFRDKEIKTKFFSSPSGSRGFSSRKGQEMKAMRFGAGDKCANLVDLVRRWSWRVALL
jgi:hypothetical protein